MEGSGGDVGFQEFLIDDVDDGRDQGFDIFRTGGEGFYVVCTIGSKSVPGLQFAIGKKQSVFGILELKSRKSWRYRMRVSRWTYKSLRLTCFIGRSFIAGSMVTVGTFYFCNE